MLLLMNYQCSVLLYYLGPLGRMVQSVPKELPHCNNFTVYVIIIVIKVSIYLSVYLSIPSNIVNNIAGNSFYLTSGVQGRNITGNELQAT